MSVPEPGSTLNGYLITEDFRIAGGGTCQWTFATRDGTDYFLKVFLDPRLPRADSPGSEATKQKIRERCRQFEGHQRDLMERVRRVTGEGGNLIAPTDFFEHEGRYFKVSRKVTVTPDAARKMCDKPITERINLCINICSAIMLLHNNSIVHGDLKLDNILIESQSGGLFTARVIDFDSSYVVGAPPSADEMIGDPPYYSPELLNYVQELATTAELTTSSDVFSLGVVFCEYFTGQKPLWSSSHHYLAEAVRDGHIPVIPPIPEDQGRARDLEILLLSMLDPKISNRPPLIALSARLKALRDRPTASLRSLPDERDSPTTEPRSSRLRGSTTPPEGPTESEPKVSTEHDVPTAAPPDSLPSGKESPVVEDVISTAIRRIRDLLDDIGTPRVTPVVAPPRTALRGKLMATPPDDTVPKEPTLILEVLATVESQLCDLRGHLDP